MLTTDGRKRELRFAASTVVRLGQKHDDVGMIPDVDEKQKLRILVAETRDFVFTSGMRLAGGYERKGYLRHNLICLLGVRGKGETGEASQHQEYAHE